MAGVVVGISDTVSPLLRSALYTIPDFRKPLTQAGQVVQRSFLYQFQAGGIPPWEPLAKATVRRRRNGSNLPLSDTGRLRRSYTSRAATGSRYQLNRYSLRIGSNLEYSAVHQYGHTFERTTKAGRRLMRKTDKGQYRFMKSNRKRGAALGVFWAGGKPYMQRVPSRPLKIQPGDIKTITHIMSRHVLDALKKR